MQNKLSVEMGPGPEGAHFAIHILRGDLRGPSADCSPPFEELSAVIDLPQNSLCMICPTHVSSGALPLVNSTCSSR